jgi:hypothetical protein
MDLRKQGPQRWPMTDRTVRDLPSPCHLVKVKSTELT